MELIWEKYQTLYESIEGEYWIDEGGDVMFADGDIGDMNHAAYVLERVMGELFGYFEMESDEYAGDFTDGDNDKKLIEFFVNEYENLEEFEDSDLVANEIKSDLEPQGIDWSDENQRNEYVYENIKHLATLYLKTQGVENAEKMIGLGFGDEDPIEYSIQEYGWKRVHGNWIQTWNLTQEDLKTIIDGLYSIFEQEMGDGYIESGRAEKEMFNIDVTSSGRVFYDIPFHVLFDGNLRKLIPYRNR